MNTTNKKGFTLIELLIVIVIIGVLSGLAVPRLAGRTEKARVQAAESDIKGGIALALDLYESDTSRYPADLAQLAGPYLNGGKGPQDPWQSSYVYRFPGQWNKGGYDLLSMGPDKTEGTEDDIKNW